MDHFHIIHKFIVDLKKAMFSYCCKNKEVLFLACVGQAAAFKDCCGGLTPVR